MPDVKYLAMPTPDARALQAGAPDANGQRPERKRSDGPGNPCRHCLTEIAVGAEMLVLAYRPFEALQPYAEVGPIFLHAEPCERHDETATLPNMLAGYERLLARGYGHDNRIVYGTGLVVDTADLTKRCSTLLDDTAVAYVHLRSASNNCYQCRVERQEPDRP